MPVICSCRKFDDYSVYPKITTIPYKDICFQLDLMKDSVEEQVNELKQKMVVINQELDRILTIKQLKDEAKNYMLVAKEATQHNMEL